MRLRELSTPGAPSKVTPDQRPKLGEANATQFGRSSDERHRPTRRQSVCDHPVVPLPVLVQRQKQRDPDCNPADVRCPPHGGAVLDG